MDVASGGWQAGYSPQQWAERCAVASSRGLPMPPTAWFIRPHLWWFRCTTPRSYSDQDVLRLLGSTDPAPEDRSRAEAVRACAARPAIWIERLDAAATRELGPSGAAPADDRVLVLRGRSRGRDWLPSWTLPRCLGG